MCFKLLLFVTFSAVSAWHVLPCQAETVSICDAADSDDYLTKASGQFLRGATNLGFCWVELFHQPALEAKSGNGNLFYGVAKGVGHTAVRALKGVGDIATFVAPHRYEDGTFAAVADDCAFGSAGLEAR